MAAAWIETDVSPWYERMCIDMGRVRAVAAAMVAAYEECVASSW